MARADPDLGERVFHLRKDLGWTQGTLGRHMRNQGHPTWSHGTVSLLEDGNRFLRLHEGFTMAEMFCISLYDLAYGPRGPDLVISHAHRLRSERAYLCGQLRELDRALGNSRY
jgi:hypothetical protein